MQRLSSIDFKNKTLALNDYSEAKVLIWYTIRNEIWVSKSLALLRLYQTSTGKTDPLLSRMIEICLMRQAFFGSSLSAQEIINVHDKKVD